jgi:hypothetical protein
VVELLAPPPGGIPNKKNSTSLDAFPAPLFGLRQKKSVCDDMGTCDADIPTNE